MSTASARPPVLVLGTAQLGIAYGAANTSGLPGAPEAAAILAKAFAAGIRIVDTARAYGEAEKRIGAALDRRKRGDVTVITKLAPLDDFEGSENGPRAMAAAPASIDASCRALGRTGLDVLLLHRARHRDAWNGLVWSFLCGLRDAGQIGRLGVSVQTPAEALAALADANVQHLQLPFNLLDYRWEAAGVIGALQSRADVTVHARSTLLQGLLTGSVGARWPLLSGVTPAALLSRLQTIARDLQRESLVDLCLAYVRAQGWIHGIVVGMESLDQLRTNLRLFAREPLRADEARSVAARVPRVPEFLLDPARWPTERGPA